MFALFLDNNVLGRPRKTPVVSPVQGRPGFLGIRYTGAFFISGYNFGYIWMIFGYFGVFWRIFFGYTGVPLPHLADPASRRGKNSEYGI